MTSTPLSFTMYFENTLISLKLSDDNFLISLLMSQAHTPLEYMSTEDVVKHCDLEFLHYE